MESTYPSSQSFFESSSDSYPALEMEKCKTMSSSLLTDLFLSHSKSKSDLLTTSRIPVFVPAEISFPTRKSRECGDRAAEKVSLWHEWGSGECPGEESTCSSPGKQRSLSSDFFGSSSNLFPNSGTTDMNLLAEDYKFPERKKRVDVSWRERRGLRADTVSIADVVFSTDDDEQKAKSVVNTNNLSGRPCPIGTTKVSHKASSEISLSSPSETAPRGRSRTSASEASTHSTNDCTTSGRGSTGGNSFAGLYSTCSAIKCSSLFSNIGGTDSGDVVFPARRNNPDRNVWRDWCNTGYSEWAEDNDSEETAQVKARKGLNVQGTSDLWRSKPGHLESKLLIRSAEKDHLHQSSESPKSVLDVALEIIEQISYISKEESLTSAQLEVELDAEHKMIEAHECNRRLDSCLKEEDCSDGVHEPAGRARLSRFNSLDKRIRRMKSQNFPPPLDSLRRQGSLRDPHHVPCVQLQAVRTKGRLMLQEVKVTQPVVFEPIREQGRLVLQMITQNDTNEPADECGGEIITPDDEIRSLSTEVYSEVTRELVEAEREDGTVSQSKLFTDEGPEERGWNSPVVARKNKSMTHKEGSLQVKSFVGSLVSWGNVDRGTFLLYAYTIHYEYLVTAMLVFFLCSMSIGNVHGTKVRFDENR